MLKYIDFKNISKKTVLRGFIVLMLCFITFFIYESSKEKEVIYNYLNRYYIQVTFDSDVKMQLEEELNDYLTIKDLAKEENEEIHYSPFQYQYLDFLTEKMINELAENNKLPNFDLIDLGIENNIKEYKILKFKAKKKNMKEYNVSYELLLKDIEGKEKIVNYNEIYMLKRQDNKYKINYIGRTLE